MIWGIYSVRLATNYFCDISLGEEVLIQEQNCSLMLLLLLLNVKHVSLYCYLRPRTVSSNLIWSLFVNVSFITKFKGENGIAQTNLSPHFVREISGLQHKSEWFTVSCFHNENFSKIVSLFSKNSTFVTKLCITFGTVLTSHVHYVFLQTKLEHLSCVVAIIGEVVYLIAEVQNVRLCF